MKFKIAFSILLLASISCDKNQYALDFCTDCSLKTDAIQVIENKPGWIVYDDNYKKFFIEVAHYNEPIFYVPCLIPKYFEPHEMTAVKFSGTITCDPLITGDQIRTTMYCIKLDTLFVTVQLLR